MRPMLSAAVGLAAVAAAPSAAADPKDAHPAPRMSDATKRDVDKALGWLKGRQSRDGSWAGNTAVSAFAVLAYLANGHVPGRGPYGGVVADGVGFLVGSADADGLLVGHGRQRMSSQAAMYAHGLATLALSQAIGMAPDDRVRAVLRRAVGRIVAAQNAEGGWRYSPTPGDADISVTIMMVMALRGAKDSGLFVPDDILNKALGYIRRCHHPASGGFTYQPSRHDPGFARTAAGLCVLQLCGQYDAAEVDRAVRFLDARNDDGRHYWYGHYYAAHALHQVGGPAWAEYYDRMEGKLRRKQRPAGNWDDPRERDHGHLSGGHREYQTAIAVLVLSVPSHYLPIYQR